MTAFLRGKAVSLADTFSLCILYKVYSNSTVEISLRHIDVCMIYTASAHARHLVHIEATISNALLCTYISTLHSASPRAAIRHWSLTIVVTTVYRRAECRSRCHGAASGRTSGFVLYIVQYVFFRGLL